MSLTRITPIPPGTRPELAAQEAGITAERGRVSLLYQVLLNSPPLAHGWEQMMTAVRNRSSLGADVREMADKGFADVFMGDLYGAESEAILRVRKPIRPRAGMVNSRWTCP